jgi:hypothetical protein
MKPIVVHPQSTQGVNVVPTLLTGESRTRGSPVVAAHDVSDDARQSTAANHALLCCLATHSTPPQEEHCALNFPLRVW